MDLPRCEPADLEVEPLVVAAVGVRANGQVYLGRVCLLYTSDAADE